MQAGPSRGPAVCPPKQRLTQPIAPDNWRGHLEFGRAWPSSACDAKSFLTSIRPHLAVPVLLSFDSPVVEPRPPIGKSPDLGRFLWQLSCVSGSSIANSGIRRRTLLALTPGQSSVATPPKPLLTPALWQPRPSAQPTPGKRHVNHG
jgi:hypothetical protein